PAMLNARTTKETLSVERSQPVNIRKDRIRELLETGAVLYDQENRRAVWFWHVLTFSIAQNICFEVLWKNFLQGNLPIPQERVLAGWRGSSTHVSFLFKRHPAWTNGIIVGDGRGNLWLNVPSDGDPMALPSDGQPNAPASAWAPSLRAI